MSFWSGFRSGKKTVENIASIGSSATKLFSKPKSRKTDQNKELRELQTLYNEVQEAFRESVFADLDYSYLAATVASDAIEIVGIEKTSPILEPLYDLCMDLLCEDDLRNPPEINWNFDFDIEERILLAKDLRRLKRIYLNNDKELDLWAQNLERLLGAILLELPKGSCIEKTESNFSTNLTAILDSPKSVINGFIGVLFQEQLIKSGLYLTVRKQLEINALGISKIPYDERNHTSKEIVLPTESKLDDAEAIEQYLKGTVLKKIFYSKIPVSIPQELRFEHFHLLAGTGHGKTQAIQTLVLDDLKNQRGFAVIDSQGDLIRNISSLEIFNPNGENNLKDKIVIVDPTDITFPTCLNIFAMTEGLNKGEVSYEKELLLNQTVDLYAYLFGALFGAELTSRQGTVFSYIARLMVEIPNANIQTLRELMEDGKQYTQYMDKLEGSAKAFFKTQFFSTSFTQSKKQVLTRLWSVLSNPTLERMFSNTENKVNVTKILNEGKILLVNTSKELLQRDGASILGRFFIALISQAIIQRASIAKDKRTPYMVYIDEAHEYFDYRLEDILNQARKYKVGFTLAHQNIGQLGDLKSTFFSSTSIKLAGGVSALDARSMSSEMHTSADDILSAKKIGSDTEFKAYFKNVTESAISLSFPFGLLEKLPSMDYESYRALMENNREKYCNHISKINLNVQFKEKAEKQKAIKEVKQYLDKDEPKESIVEFVTKSKTAEPEKEFKQKPPDSESDIVLKSKEVKVQREGKGGIEHKYLQNLVRKLSLQKGFKTSLEKSVLSGTGLIDVYLEGYDQKIAVEISVTTDWKHEAGNVTKCLSSGADVVIVLSSEISHLDKLEKNILKELGENKKLYFFTPNQLISFLDKKRAESASEVKKVAGYKVKTVYYPNSDKEVKAKKDAIAKVLLEAEYS